VVVALALLALSALATRRASPQQIAYQAALGALMLAVMSVPLGPFAYHLSLLGVVGLLLGAAGSFQVVMAVSATLALFGHGGLTVVGLNGLVLGAGAAVARPTYRLLRRVAAPAWRAALATVASQLVSGAALVAVVAGARSESLLAARHAHPDPAVFAGLAFPLWLVGVALEAAVAYGVVRFLERVQPALLPDPPEART
jgi:cobalt/nickel transport system permease protein